ncbi:hypothetical protein KPSA3_07480 [Pseudomonas syringae pv. actinidiae]|uniref:Uncharacterized protein n=1 Tax=Pseudomonas syringae pv. actinidiae TaxID=103796 RepID=A0AAN4QCB9_PSESF|nr:hypothetical protein KPSA3_07480 [Pseudomonas syringae pv. actinidiae]
MFSGYRVLSTFQKTMHVEICSIIFAFQLFRPLQSPLQ